MPEIGETKRKGMLFWVCPDPASSRELIEATAREFDLAARFCDYGDLFDRVRTTPCELLGVELDANPGQALTLIKDLHQRLPLMTIIAASGDGSDTMIRAALEAGARDF